MYDSDIHELVRRYCLQCRGYSPFHDLSRHHIRGYSNQVDVCDPEYYMSMTTRLLEGRLTSVILGKIMLANALVDIDFMTSVLFWKSGSHILVLKRRQSCRRNLLWVLPTVLQTRISLPQQIYVC